MLTRSDMKLIAAFCVALVTLGAADDCYVGDSDMWYGDIYSWWSDDFELCKQSCRTDSRLFLKLTKQTSKCVTCLTLMIVLLGHCSLQLSITIYLVPKIQSSRSRFLAFTRSKPHFSSLEVSLEISLEISKGGWLANFTTGCPLWSMGQAGTDFFIQIERDTIVDNGDLLFFDKLCIYFRISFILEVAKH